MKTLHGRRRGSVFGCAFEMPIRFALVVPVVTVSLGCATVFTGAR
jgi:hypothetical protein